MAAKPYEEAPGAHAMYRVRPGGLPVAGAGRAPGRTAQLSEGPRPWSLPLLAAVLPFGRGARCSANWSIG